MASRTSRKTRTRSEMTPQSTGATTGYEAELWQMADTLRGSMDAAEYKHVVLGLIFLKYISDAFEERHARLVGEQKQGADPEDSDEYRAENIFWVPPEARWTHLKAQAKQPTIGQLVDDAMSGIERDNPALNNVLPKDYARPALDKQRLGQPIDLISNIKVGDEEARSKDVLGRVYEYFLSQFASAEGKKGGEFYTPRCVVKLLVEMLEPYRGRVYDPCCGSSGMFVQSVEFIRAHATGTGNGVSASLGATVLGRPTSRLWTITKSKEEGSHVEAYRSSRGDSERRACGTGRDSNDVRAPDQCAAEPGQPDYRRQAFRNRRHRPAVRALVRSRSSVLAEPPDAIRSRRRRPASWSVGA